MAFSFSPAIWEAKGINSKAVSLKFLGENDFQPRILYPANVSVKCERRIKIIFVHRNSAYQQNKKVNQGKQTFEPERKSMAHSLMVDSI